MSKMLIDVNTFYIQVLIEINISYLQRYKNQKIQRYFYRRHLGEDCLNQLPDGGKVGPVAFGVVIAPTNQKAEDEYTEDGTGKSAQQHRQSSQPRVAWA